MNRLLKKTYKYRTTAFAFFCVAALACCAVQSSAQFDKMYAFRAPFSVRFSYQLLSSTHGDNFTGGSIDFNVSASTHWRVGAGVQYAANHRHFDNGWTLTHLHFLPLYVTTIYTFCPTCRFQPYLHSEEGISFNHYYKTDPAVSNMPYKIAETGLYLSGNAGLNVTTANDGKIFTEMGYKGFKHSLNDLDVNPHGFAVRTGFEASR